MITQGRQYLMDTNVLLLHAKKINLIFIYTTLYNRHFFVSTFTKRP